MVPVLGKGQRLRAEWHCLVMTLVGLLPVMGANVQGNFHMWSFCRAWLDLLESGSLKEKGSGTDTSLEGKKAGTVLPPKAPSCSVSV